MEWVETTGRTIAEAKDAALDQLGVDEQDAEFDIVEEPKFGLFGRLRSEARIRARVRPTKPRPKDDRRRRKERETGASPSGGTASVSSADLPSGATGRRRTKTSDRPAGDVAAADGIDPQAEPGPREGRDSRPDGAGRAGRPTRARSADAAAEAGSEERPAAVRRQRATVGSSHGSGESSTRTRDVGEARSANEPRGANEPRDEGARMDVSLDEQGAVGRTFLDGLVGLLDLAGDINVDRPDEETVELNLEGEELGLLIGPKGTTLLALQDLTRTVVQRRTGAGNGRLVVDIAGYRRKRKEALERFTRQLAQEVIASGERKVLEPMAAADRKIVHDAVTGLEGVSTSSEGEEPRRRVVIQPDQR